MKNDEQPADSGLPWNTDDLVFGGITCKQLSRLCTCFISALRMANGDGEEFGIKGKMNLVRTLIDQQLKLAAAPDLSPEDRKKIEDNLEIGLQSVCLAGLFSIDKIDVRHLTSVAVSTIGVIHKLAESTGPIGYDDEVVVQIRKKAEVYGEETIEMGVRLEPTMDLFEKAGLENLTKQIKNIVHPPTPNPPKIEENEQGLN